MTTSGMTTKVSLVFFCASSAICPDICPFDSPHVDFAVLFLSCGSRGIPPYLLRSRPHSAPGDRIQNMDYGTTVTPLGLSYFPKEMVKLPRKYVPPHLFDEPAQGRALLDLPDGTKVQTLVFESEHESGGHFAAH
jgi:hypothetical protein